jgi:hypothetical protein
VAAPGRGGGNAPTWDLRRKRPRVALHCNCGFVRVLFLSPLASHPHAPPLHPAPPLAAALRRGIRHPRRLPPARARPRAPRPPAGESPPHPRRHLLGRLLHRPLEGPAARTRPARHRPPSAPPLGQGRPPRPPALRRFRQRPARRRPPPPRRHTPRPRRPGILDLPRLAPHGPAGVDPQPAPRQAAQPLDRLALRAVVPAQPGFVRNPATRGRRAVRKTRPQPPRPATRPPGPLRQALAFAGGQRR